MFVSYKHCIIFDMYLKTRIMKIEFKGYQLDVEFDCQPDEPENGIRAFVEIESVKIDGVDITELMDNDFEEIENLVINQLDDYYE